MTFPPEVLAHAREAVRDAAGSTNPEVRRHREPWAPTTKPGKFFLWLLSPILDTHDNYPSAPRICAWVFTIAAARGVQVSASLATPIIGTMWGYSAWKDYQARTSSTLAATQNTALEFKRDVTEHVEHTITEVRGPAGEPMHSLPPVPGAKTPSGEE